MGIKSITSVKELKQYASSFEDEEKLVHRLFSRSNDLERYFESIFNDRQVDQNFAGKLIGHFQNLIRKGVVPEKRIEKVIEISQDLLHNRLAIQLEGESEPKFIVNKVACVAANRYFVFPKENQPLVLSKSVLESSIHGENQGLNVEDLELAITLSRLLKTNLEANLKELVTDENLERIVNVSKKLSSDPLRRLCLEFLKNQIGIKDDLEGFSNHALLEPQILELMRLRKHLQFFPLSVTDEHLTPLLCLAKKLNSHIFFKMCLGYIQDKIGVVFTGYYCDLDIFHLTVESIEDVEVCKKYLDMIPGNLKISLRPRASQDLMILKKFCHFFSEAIAIFQLDQDIKSMKENETLDVIQMCSKLERLSFKNCQFLNCLSFDPASLSKLKQLNIENCSNLKFFLRGFDDLKNIQEVIIQGKSALDDLKTLLPTLVTNFQNKTLKTLNTSINLEGESLKTCLRVNSKDLNHFRIILTQISNDELEQIKLFLEGISIRFSLSLEVVYSSEISHNQIETFVKDFAKKVETLVLHVPTEFLKPQAFQDLFNSCQNLKNLTLKGEGITLEHLKDCSTLKTLEMLSIQECLNLKELPIEISQLRLVKGMKMLKCSFLSKESLLSFIFSYFKKSYSIGKHFLNKFQTDQFEGHLHDLVYDHLGLFFSQIYGVDLQNGEKLVAILKENGFVRPTLSIYRNLKLICAFGEKKIMPAFLSTTKLTEDDCRTLLECYSQFGYKEPTFD